MLTAEKVRANREAFDGTYHAMVHVFGDMDWFMLDPEKDFSNAGRYGLNIHAVGYKLDNASGHNIRMDAIMNGYQEFVLIAETFYNMRLGDKFLKGKFNLASLLAFVRAIPNESDISNMVGTSMFQEHKALMTILEPCRVDLHEPDEQDVYAFLDVTSTSVVPEGYHMPMKIRLERGKLSAEIDAHRLFGLAIVATRRYRTYLND